MLRRQLLCAFATALVAMPMGASAQDDFFKGKTVTYIVATNPGGGYDTYGRLVAKYMEKHLPGTKFIVKNVPGAGHIVGANTVHAAKPDGLTIGTFNTGLIYNQLLKREGIQFDLAKMSWIGKASDDLRCLVLGTNSGFKSFDEATKAKQPLKLAAAGLGSAAYVDTKILAEALKLNVQIVPGFEGTEGEMSILRGELAGTVATASSLEQFVKNGQGFYALAISGNSNALPGVPRASQYVKDERGRKLLAMIEALSEIGRLTAGPPGIPADRLKTLRDTYMKALNDPELRAEAEKLSSPIDPAPGEQVAKLISTALQQPPETIALLGEAMKSK